MKEVSLISEKFLRNGLNYWDPNARFTRPTLPKLLFNGKKSEVLFVC